MMGRDGKTGVAQVRQNRHNCGVQCPLCSTRKARRRCPALQQDICALCCGTKRLVEIRCPADCAYLASSREHPPAAVARQQQRDLAAFIQPMQGLNQRQSELFVALNTALRRYQPPDFQTLNDGDIVEAAGAMAATLETRSRGVIYDHRPGSLPAERLIGALRPLLTEGERTGGSSFEREAGVVLRRLEKAVGAAQQTMPGGNRRYLDLIGRVLSKADRDAAQPAHPDEPRLIVP
jgi:hypothetical protein